MPSSSPVAGPRAAALRCPGAGHPAGSALLLAEVDHP